MTRRELLAGMSLLAGCSHPGDGYPGLGNLRPQHDRLRLADPGDVRLGGYLGEKINLCIRHRVMAQDRHPEHVHVAILQRAGLIVVDLLVAEQ